LQAGGAVKLQGKSEKIEIFNVIFTVVLSETTNIIPNFDWVS
jgi:hypothetical protein